MSQLLIALFLSLLAFEISSLGYKDLAVANNKFGINLYKKLTEEEKNNIIFSPVSISFALALTSLGAKGITLKEITDTLQVSDVPADQIHGKYKEFMNDILRDGDDIQVSLANRLFVEKKFFILPEFLQKSNDNYGAKPESLDFSKADEVASIVNNWISEKTKKNIEEIISESDISTATVLLLVNALYFKSIWEKTFREHYTAKKSFRVSPKILVRTDFMHDYNSDGMYGFNEKYQFGVFEKYFHEKQFTFGIILPDLEKTSLEKIERDFSIDQLDSIEMIESIVNVTIPKFKIETSFQLNKVLLKLGTRHMFGLDGDLSGIDGSLLLFVSKVLHKAVVDVDEKGVVAAASTVVIMDTKMGPVLPDVDFVADHPFLFYIRHKDSGSFLFFGKFSKP